MYGSRDDDKAFEAIIALACREKVIMTCGPFCHFVHSLLRKHEIESRVVAVKPLEAYNGFYGLNLETTLYSTAGRNRWYRRIMHIPVQYDGGTPYCTGIEQERPEIERLWPELVFLPINAFRRRFYPSE